jgi:hypothetical protein
MSPALRHAAEKHSREIGSETSMGGPHSFFLNHFQVFNLVALLLRSRGIDNE